MSSIVAGTLPRRRQTGRPDVNVGRVISQSLARRIALAAQGFGDGAEARRSPTERRRILDLVSRLGVVQLDSVNVLCRAHYLPFFARLGSYDRDLLDACAWGPKPGLFEYWGHEASLLPIDSQPLFRWRMERAAQGERVWGHIARFGKDKKEYVEDVLAEVAARGPLRASEIESGERRKGRWWTRSDAKIALEWLFWTGRVAASSRKNFERRYDLPERVLPAKVLSKPTPDVETAHRELLLIAAHALGVATQDDLSDYFRLPRSAIGARVRELVEEGLLEETAVDGWEKTAYLDPARLGTKKKRVAALLTPFDPLIWYRPRAQRLFGFHYRIEIYTPPEKRAHGYYVLPFLLGDRLVARVDLKSDRAESTLRVQASHLEDHAEGSAIAPPLADELRRLAEWLGLERVAVAKKGKLSPALRAAIKP
jgi:uncharacterized protein YcaQ